MQLVSGSEKIALGGEVRRFHDHAFPVTSSANRSIERCLVGDADAHPGQ
jgi:hypothetical protein